MRFTKALNPTNILRWSQRALGAQNYILENCETVLGPKEIFGRFKNALLVLKRFFRDVKGPWELSKLGSLKEQGWGMGRSWGLKNPEHDFWTIWEAPKGVKRFWGWLKSSWIRVQEKGVNWKIKQGDTEVERDVHAPLQKTNLCHSWNELGYPPAS